MRKLVIALIIVFGFFSVSIIGLIMMLSPEAEELDRKDVAIINLDGVIEESPMDFDTGISPDYVRGQLNKVEQLENAKAAVLRVNSPGGSVASSQEIASIVESFDHPIVISMGDVAASGGYYISAPGDHIISQPGSTTGSIGVISVTMDPTGLYENIGIDVDVFSSGEHKDMGYRNLTEEEREKMQTLSDDYYQQFIDDVSIYRGINREEVEELATGEVFTGRQAKDLKLVDELGSLTDAINKAGDLAGIDDPRGYRLEDPSGLFENLLNIPGLVERRFSPDKVQLLETLEQDTSLKFRYQLR